MKTIKHFIMLSLLLVSSVSYGMKRQQDYRLYPNASEQMYDAKVQAYFAPGDRKAMKDDLFSLLDNAKSSIYVVMYWITDDSLIDKLIAAKKRNVTVEVYIDQSSPNLYIEKLLSNDIVPLIFPSGPQVGILHDKFFIIDFKAVFTGSANFTKAAFDDTSPNLNRENSIIIHSEEIASTFLKEFVNIQITIFDLYIDMISQYESKNLPVWLTKLWPILFKKEGRLSRAFYSRMNKFGDAQRDRANEFIRKATQD